MCLLIKNLTEGKCKGKTKIICSGGKFVQCHGYHCHGYTCVKNRAITQEMNIANNGCSIRCGLVSIWRCEKPILKKVRLWFEKGFKPYLRFIVYNFEFILVSVNEKSIDDLTYSWRNTPNSVAIHDTPGREALVDEHPERLTERFFKVLAENQELTVTDVLKRRSYPSCFQILSRKLKIQWKQWANLVPVTSDCNWTRNYSHLIRKRTPNYLSKLAKLGQFG